MGGAENDGGGMYGDTLDARSPHQWDRSFQLARGHRDVFLEVDYGKKIQHEF